MAERRMFAKTIIDSDAFLDMPQSSQLLYFHLSMRADDDGFINKPKSIMRICGCKDDDIKLLIAKSFIIPFESGIVVIKHWKIHNYIAKDRYTETKYKDEKATLILDENKSYTARIQGVYEMETQDRIGKDRLGKVRLGEDRGGKESQVSTLPPTLKEIKQFALERNSILSAEKFYNFFNPEWTDSNGNKVKDWKKKFITWENREQQFEGKKSKQNNCTGFGTNKSSLDIAELDKMITYGNG